MAARALRVLSALAGLAVAALAQASPFFFPPEQNLPGWQTAFPYQRNIDFTFDDPLNVLAPHYEGTLDPDLKYSDEMMWEGHLWNLRWGEDFVNGAIGAYYDGNEADKTLNLRWRFDNVPEPRPLKHIYIEMVYKYTGNPAGGPFVEAPDHEVTNPLFEVSQPGFLEDSWYLWRAEYDIFPNPQWEVLGINIQLQNPGDAYWIDRLHVATECVPEPTSLAAMAFAIGMSGVFFRRRR